MFHHFLGSEQASDAALVCCDGETIPIHYIVMHQSSPALTKAIGHEMCTFKSTKHDPGAVVHIGVDVDYQTVWRVLSFIYTGSYSDDDTTKVFPISPFPKPVLIQLEEELPLFRVDMDDGLSSLYRNMQRLLIAPSTSAPSVLAQAGVAFKVYRTATVWGMPRLMAEVSHRFGTLVLRASKGPDFKYLVHAVYEYFPDKEFTDAIVEECVSNIGPLLANDEFMRHLGQQSQLWIQILEKIVMQQGDFQKEPPPQIPSQLLLTDTPYNQDGGNNQPLIASLEAKVIEIESQLQEQIEVTHHRGDLLDQADVDLRDLEEQVTKLRESHQSSSDDSASVTALKAHNKQLLERSNIQTGLVTQLTNQIHRSSSSGRENNTQVFLKQKEEQDTQILDLRQECDSKTKQLSAVELELIKVKAELQAKSDELAHAHKTVKRDGVGAHLLNRQLSIIKSTLINPDKRLQDESKTSPNAAHDFALHHASPMPITNGKSSPVPQSPSSKANAPVNGCVTTTQATSPDTTRSVGGDGKHGQIGQGEVPMNGSSTPTVISTSTSAPVVTSPVVAAHDVAADVGKFFSGGPETFFHRQQRILRQQNAGIIDRGSDSSSDGAVAQPPASMQVVTRTPVAASQTPAQAVSSLAAVGPGFASQSPVRAPAQYPALIPIRAPAPSQAQAPAATPAVAPAPAPTQRSSAPAAAAGPHAGPEAMAALQRNYERLKRNFEYIKQQLSDARTGPAATMNTRAPPSGSSHGDPARLKKLLAAIKEANCEHRCCSDCSINFMSQFRGITEDANNRNLIMKCLKCEAEVFRWEI